MPVQIPQLKRFDAGMEAQAPTGHIDFQAHDLTTGVLNTTKEIESIGAEQANFLGRLKEDAAQTKSQEVANRKEQWAKGETGRLRNIEGDPTKAYADHAQDSEHFNQQLMEEYKDTDDRTKQLIQNKLMGVDRRTNDTMALNQGLQYQTYQRQTDADGIANLQDHAVGLSANIATGDPKGRQDFDSAMETIRQQILVSGGRRGLVSNVEDKNDLDADGKPKIKQVVDPMLSREMNQAVGKAVFQTVQTLNNSGQFKQSEELQAQYHDALTGQQIEALSKDRTSAKDDTTAANYADSVRFMDPSVAIQKAMNDKSLDATQREKTISKIHTQAAQIQQTLDMQRKKMYEQASSYVADSNFVTVDQMKNSPLMKNRWDKLDGQQKEALMNMVDAPKVTKDLSRRNQMYDDVQSGAYDGISRADFDLKTAGLGTKDKAFAEKQWQISNVPDRAKEAASVKYMFKQVTAQLEASGDIKKASFGGGYDKKSKPILNSAHDYLAQAVGDLPGNMSQADMNSFVKDALQNHYKDRAFKYDGDQAAPKFQSAPQAPTAKPVVDATKSAVDEKTATDMVIHADKAVRNAARVAFAKDHGGRDWKASDGAAALMKYMGK